MPKKVPMENNPILMQAFNQGKKPALEEIFDLFKHDLYYFAKKLTTNPEESEEIVHESFMKLFKNHSAFETLANIKAFLFITTRNRCLDVLRSKKAFIDNYGRIIPLSELDETFEIPEATGNEPFLPAVQTEFMARIYKEIEAFPAQRKKVFKMHFLENKRVTDIANELGMAKGTVSQYITTAIAQLKAIGWLINFLLFLKLILDYLIK